MGPTNTRSLQTSCKKRVYQSAKIKNLLTFQARKTFFQAHIQSCIDYASTLWDSASESLLKSLKSLHRRAIKIILLKHTSLTNEGYKNTTFLPLKARLMCNKALLCIQFFWVRHPLTFQKRCLSTSILETAQGSLTFPRLD